jgi:SAM-dependent methyltransferase
MNSAACIVCGGNDWLPFPDPSPSKSITTSGIILDEPLGKSQCAACGMVQRTGHRYLADTDFYEKRYTGYHRRPGNVFFNRLRYAGLARWLAESIGNYVPQSILDVGCGQGLTLAELAPLYPNAAIAAIEPSAEDAEQAARRGFQVQVRKLDSMHPPDRQYDLVYSNHVLQHTADPVDFLRAMRGTASDDGRIVITLQDASIPNSELLYCDQNFAFLPQHLAALCQAAGLRVLSWRAAPDAADLKYSQLIVCGKGAQPLSAPAPTLSQEDLRSLYRGRTEYLEAWPRIEDYLLQETAGSATIYNFGAGMFTCLLACYCEQYWQRVASCAMDGFSGECLGKQVVPLEELPPSPDAAVVLGARPAIQRDLASRIADLGWRVIRWDNFVEG